MAEFPKQEVLSDRYFILTSESVGIDGKTFTTRVFGYRNKAVMYGKVYKTAHYATAKEAEEGHKALKKEFS
jgi:hypothetical protein